MQRPRSSSYPERSWIDLRGVIGQVVADDPVETTVLGLYTILSPQLGYHQESSLGTGCSLDLLILGCQPARDERCSSSLQRRRSMKNTVLQEKEKINNLARGIQSSKRFSRGEVLHSEGAGVGQWLQGRLAQSASRWGLKVYC